MNKIFMYDPINAQEMKKIYIQSKKFIDYYDKKYNFYDKYSKSFISLKKVYNKNQNKKIKSSADVGAKPPQMHFKKHNQT